MGNPGSLFLSCCCITFNARGYPPSDVPKEPALYGWQLAVDDIDALMRGLVGGTPSRVNKDRIDSSVGASVSTQECLVHSMAADQRFDPSHNDQVFRDCILHSVQAAGECINIGVRRCLLLEFIFGKQLSSSATPAAPRWRSVRARRRALLKFPNPPSPSTSTGSSVVSTMRSTTSTNWLHEASFASR
ncbi:hypothetical protein ABIB95_009393 [Bradyrhizobium sp. LA2.1]